jgi:hypothetical protein
MMSSIPKAGARGFASSIARTEAAALLVEHASAQGDQAAVTASSADERSSGCLGCWSGIRKGIKGISRRVNQVERKDT